MVSFRVCILLLSLRILLSFDSDSDESHRRRRAHAAHFHHYPSSGSESVRDDDTVHNDTAAMSSSGDPTSSLDASATVPQQISMTSGQAFLAGSPMEPVAAGVALGNSTASRGALKSEAQGTDSSASDGARNHRMRLNIALSTLASTVAELPSTEAWIPSEGVVTLLLSCVETLAPEYTQAELHDTLLAYLVGQGQSALQAGDRIRRLRLWLLQQGGCQHLSNAGQSVFKMSPACAIHHVQAKGYDRREASCEHVLKSGLFVFSFGQVNRTHLAAHHDMRCLGFSHSRCYSFVEVPAKIFWSKSMIHHKPWVRRLPCHMLDKDFTWGHPQPGFAPMYSMLSRTGSTCMAKVSDSLGIASSCCRLELDSGIEFDHLTKQFTCICPSTLDTSLHYDNGAHLTVVKRKPTCIDLMEMDVSHAFQDSRCIQDSQVRMAVCCKPLAVFILSIAACASQTHCSCMTSMMLKTAVQLAWRSPRQMHTSGSCGIQRSEVRGVPGQALAMLCKPFNH